MLKCKTNEERNILDGRAVMGGLPYRAHVAVRLGEQLRDLTLSKNEFRDYDEEGLIKGMRTNLKNTDMLEVVQEIVNEDSTELITLKEEYKEAYYKKLTATKKWQKILEGWYEGEMAGLEIALRLKDVDGNGIMELREEVETNVRRIGTLDEV